MGDDISSGSPHDTENSTSLRSVASDESVEASSNAIRLFRKLAIVNSAALILSTVVQNVESRMMPEGGADLLNYNGVFAMITLPNSVSWLSTLIHISAVVGLYQFSKAARALYTLLIFGFSVLLLFTGFCITSPIVGFLAQVSGLTCGALLLMSYATPLKEKFN